MNITVLIIVVVCVVILGVVSVLMDIYRRVRQQKLIYDYTAQIVSLQNKLAKHKDGIEESKYIIAYAHEISRLFDCPLHPAISLSSSLSRHITFGIEKYIDEIGEAELQTQIRLDKEKRQLYKVFFNPFTLFYRGIGLVLRYVFGYLIELFNKDFDYEGKTWKIINLVVTLAASIFTIMTFFGYDWAKIVKIFS